MRNLLLTIAYDGAAYHGWQVQENAQTVQQAFQEAAGRVLGVCPSLKGCSRTDTGVHARQFCLSMKTEHAIPCGRLVDALNHFLPADIAVLSCREVPEEFHARYSCRGKEYEYCIWNARVRSPFLRARAYHYYYPLQVEAMNEAAGALRGILRETEGVTDISEAATTGTPEVRITVDKSAAMRYNLTTAQIYADLAQAVANETTSTTLTVGADSIPVVVLRGGAGRVTRDNLMNYTFDATNAEGETQTVRLGDIAALSEADSVPSIRRENGQRTMSVTAGVDALPGGGARVVSRNKTAVAVYFYTGSSCSDKRVGRCSESHNYCVYLKFKFASLYLYGSASS